MSDSEFQHISIIIISQAVIKHGHINAHTALLQPTSPPQPPPPPHGATSPRSLLTKRQPQKDTDVLGLRMGGIKGAHSAPEPVRGRGG